MLEPTLLNCREQYRSCRKELLSVPLNECSGGRANAHN